MKARDLASSVSPKRGRVLGYFTNWVQYRSRGYAFVPESINPMLFTDIAYRLHSQPLAPPGLNWQVYDMATSSMYAYSGTQWVSMTTWPQ